MSNLALTLSAGNGRIARVNANLPLWVEHGSDEDAALAAALAEEAELIAAGDAVLRRMEAERLRFVVVRPPVPSRVPDYAI